MSSQRKIQNHRCTKKRGYLQNPVPRLWLGLHQGEWGAQESVQTIWQMEWGSSPFMGKTIPSKLGRCWSNRHRFELFQKKSVGDTHKNKNDTNLDCGLKMPDIGTLGSHIKYITFFLFILYIFFFIFFSLYILIFKYYFYSFFLHFYFSSFVFIWLVCGYYCY